jgi:hypothetical protein
VFCAEWRFVIAVLATQYVPRLMTTGWGRALMATPLIGQAVGMFAKGYAGIVASELKKCTLAPPRSALHRPAAAARRRQLWPAGTPSDRTGRLQTHASLAHSACRLDAQTACGTRT